MTALAKDRATTQKRGPDGRRVSVPVAAATVIYAGGMVALDTSGNAVPAANTAGLRVIGRAAKQVDNSGGSAGSKRVDVDRGIFSFENAAAGQAIAAAQVGLPCFVVDDQTVGKYATAGVYAGIVHQIDPDTSDVWVDMSVEALIEAMNAGYETVTVNAGAGVISPLVHTTFLDITGTCTATLADGLYDGQEKEIVVIAGASTPALTLTCADPHGHSTVSAIGAVGDSLKLRWHKALGWSVVAANGVTINA